MIAVTFFSDHAAGAKREEQLTLAELAQRIETMAASEKSRLPWLKLARFGDKRTAKNSLRHDDNVLAISGIEGDYDGEKLGFDEAVEIAEKAGLAALLYTSPSHTPEKPRWRVLCASGEELPPTARAHLVARLNGLYGGTLAIESYTLSQGYYFGKVAGAPDYRVKLIEGQPIDRLDELDAIAIGKPNGSAGHAPGSTSSPLDEAALEQEILTGVAYHTACVRLVGKWAQAGMPFLDAQHRLEDLFDKVFPPDRDQRWRDRRADIPRIIFDIYGKQAVRDDERVEFTIGGARAGNAPEAEADPPPPVERLAFTPAQLRALPIPPADPLLGAAFSTTSRSLLVGDTGVGKTNLLVGMALAMAQGKPFLHWPAGRPARVLYIDGEMSLRLLQDRLVDATRRAGGDSDTLFILTAAALEEGIPALNHPPGQRFIEAQIAAYQYFDFILADNVMSLLDGDMSEAGPWKATLPWVRSLTNRNIGQLWAHHTGHDASRSFGTKTREWQLDNVLIAEKAERPDADLAFTLRFSKARERTPGNRSNFDPVLVALADDKWIWEVTEIEARGKKPTTRDRALDLLHDAIARLGEIPSPHSKIPEAEPCITEDQWRERFIEANISEASDESARRVFRRVAQELVERKLVGKHHPFVWVIR